MIRKPRMMQYGSKLYEQWSKSVAISFCPPMYPCVDCGAPYISGYCCTRCGSSDPSRRKNK